MIIKQYCTLQTANGKQRVLSKENGSRSVHLRTVSRCGSGVFARGQSNRLDGARFNTLELTKESARTHSNADGRFFMKFCSLGRDQTQNRTCKTQRSAVKRLDFIP